ncbi:MAG TPA: hypothetical protein VGL31_08260 [Xanthobacteraceae bacterium]|jgi:hypothetical protein
MGLLDNGGRALGQWPPSPLKHFPEKWNPVFREGGDRIRVLAAGARNAMAALRAIAA